MIKVEIEISDVDYTKLVEKYLPQITEQLRQSGNPLAMLLSNGMSSSLAKIVIEKAPESTKDKMAAELINSNADKLKAEIEDFTAQRGYGLKVGKIKAQA